MKIGVFILLLLLFTSPAAADDFKYEKNCTATVEGQTAQFSFPIQKNKPLIWDMDDTSENASEYIWEICLVGTKNNCKYTFGVYHFKCLLCDNSQPDKRGTMSDLLSICQKTVWHDGTAESDMKVDAEIKNDNLVIMITDHKTLSHLLSDKPTSVRCRVYTPYTDLNLKSETEIKYKQ